MIRDGHDPTAIAAAAQALRAGELVALPTETVYGLGADAGNDAAVARIFAAKGRPSDHPLIVHVAAAGQVDAFAHTVPAFARRLMDAFWPGPLTLILPRRPGVATAAAGGQDSIGLRCPSHPVAQALLRAARELGVQGVAAPSANRFGRVSPTTAAHVQAELGADLLILDGGPCEVGIESTIIDCSRGAPVLLRPGRITRGQIEQACGERLRSREELAAPAPRASGTLQAHYAPQAKVRLMDARMLQAALDVLGREFDGGRATIAVYARSVLRVPSTRVLYRRMPDDAAAAAQQLFAVLRDFDAQGVQLIWVEEPPADAEWEGVRDRLQRAAAAG
ncbi:MAG: L-threonylcarbamoyladenylate synthase [Hylemonella sp.]